MNAFLIAHPWIISFGLCLVFFGAVFAAFLMALGLETKDIGKMFDDPDTKL